MVPSDYTLAIMEEFKNSRSFFVVVRNPCKKGNLLPFTMPEVLVNQDSTEIITKEIPFVEVSDDIEKEQPNLCSDRAYRIVDNELYPFLTLDGN